MQVAIGLRFTENVKVGGLGYFTVLRDTPAVLAMFLSLKPRCDLHWKTRRGIATAYPIIEFFLTVCGEALFDRNGGSAFSGRVAL